MQSILIIPVSFYDWNNNKCVYMYMYMDDIMYIPMHTILHVQCYFAHNIEHDCCTFLQDGTYIVRDSTKIAGEYSLSLWHSGGVRHLRYM